MDQPTIDRLLDTLEANAEANTKLATSVGGMVGEVRSLGEKVETNTGEVQKLCAAQKAANKAKAKTTSMVWSVAKHPSTIVLTAMALWLAANVFGVAASEVPETPVTSQEEAGE